MDTGENVLKARRGAIPAAGPVSAVKLNVGGIERGENVSEKSGNIVLEISVFDSNRGTFDENIRPPGPILEIFKVDLQINVLVV